MNGAIAGESWGVEDGVWGLSCGVIGFVRDIGRLLRGYWRGVGGECENAGAVRLVFSFWLDRLGLGFLVQACVDVYLYFIDNYYG